jgi:nucleoside-diphosphate-sugar epimerase
MREYIYVEDVVDAYVKLVENIDKTKGDVFNVGTGETMNQEDMTKLIIKLSGKNISPVYKTKESIGEIDSQTLNIDKIMKIIDWKPKHSLEEGLKKTWNKWN